MSTGTPSSLSKRTSSRKSSSPQKTKRQQSSQRGQREERRSPHDEIKPPPLSDHLRSILQRYRQPDARLASWQIANTLVPYTLAWVAGWYACSWHYLLSLPASLLIGMLMLRIFVLHHDCSHGSFFRSRRANEWWGWLLGALVLTPFHRWRRSHNYHHAHSGDLDHRGEGYITLHTVKEYRKLSDRQKFWYRVYRSPWFLLVVGPCLQFIVLERFTFDLPASARVARWGVWKTNALLAGVLLAVYLSGGLTALATFFWIFLPAAVFAAVAGVWLFFVQHNYDKAYFQNHEKWNFSAAALEGSSFYDLPNWLHWFTGNIGFHHIHHLDSQIPNYRLTECHRSHVEFQNPYRITLWSSRKCIGLDLWDEKKQRLVPFSAVS
jgi:omega-6 fatty acid desaturase (delta-12 desaturase)